MDGLAGLVRHHFLLIGMYFHQQPFPADRGRVFVADAPQHIVPFPLHLGL